MTWGARALRVTAAALLVVYLGWQAVWLAQWRLPPALFLALTGWPAPTTGGTRAVASLVRGDWTASLRTNPLAIPMAALFGATLLATAWNLARHRKLHLSQAWLRAWLVLLALAWVVQSCLAIAAGR